MHGNYPPSPLSRKPQAGLHGALPFGEGWRWSLGLDREANSEGFGDSAKPGDARSPCAMFGALLCPFGDIVTTVFQGCWPKALLLRWQPFWPHRRRPPSFIELGLRSSSGLRLSETLRRRGQQKPAFRFLRGWLWLVDTAAVPRPVQSRRRTEQASCFPWLSSVRLVCLHVVFWY